MWTISPMWVGSLKTLQGLSRRSVGLDQWSPPRQRHPHPKLELRFWKSVSCADHKAETPPAEGVLCQGGDTPFQSWILGFGSQYHLLIKRWRQPPLQSWNLGFWGQCHLLVIRQTPPADSVLYQCGDSPFQSWNLGFGSQYHLLIKRQRHPPADGVLHQGRDTPVNYCFGLHRLINYPPTSYPTDFSVSHINAVQWGSGPKDLSWHWLVFSGTEHQLKLLTSFHLLL